MIAFANWPATWTGWDNGGVGMGKLSAGRKERCDVQGRGGKAWVRGGAPAPPRHGLRCRRPSSARPHVHVGQSRRPVALPVLPPSRLTASAASAGPPGPPAPSSDLGRAPRWCGPKLTSPRAGRGGAVSARGRYSSRSRPQSRRFTHAASSSGGCKSAQYVAGRARVSCHPPNA